MSSTPIKDEASQLAILNSSASDHDKAVACQMLAYVAGPKSIPALVPLLESEKLAAYARSVLEAIDDPAASKALLDALPELQGRQLAGVVDSLGVRRDKEAIPALQKLASGEAKDGQPEAIASLGMIGTPDAVAALEVILTKGPEPSKTAAGHAAIIAAEHLAREGHADDAKRLSQSLIKVFPNGPIHGAAVKLETAPQ